MLLTFNSQIMKCPRDNSSRRRRRRRCLSEYFSHTSLTLMSFLFLLAAFNTDSQAAHVNSKTHAMVSN